MLHVTARMDVLMVVPKPRRQRFNLPAGGRGQPIMKVS
jgi:hypothetical protein